MLEIDEHVRRIQPGLLGEIVRETPIGPQRLGLTTRQVQRPHLQRDELLTQRLIRDQPLQIGDRLGMAAVSISRSQRSSCATSRSSSSRVATGDNHHSDASSPNARPDHSYERVVVRSDRRRPG